MSYRLLYALVPRETVDIEKAVRKLMWPYNNDCDLELELYDERPCDCTQNGGVADPDCEYCDGEGIEEIYCNPNSRWDTCIVGDWEGETSLEECLSSPCELQLDGGAAPLKNLDVEKLEAPQVVVTPDGEWHDEDYHESDWLTVYKELLLRHEDMTLVKVLCHH